MPPIKDENPQETQDQEQEEQETSRFGPFKVVHGKYIGADPDNYVKNNGRVVKDELGYPVLAEMTKDPGSPPFYATVDLLNYNFPGMEPKFVQVGGRQDQIAFRQPAAAIQSKKGTFTDEQGDGLEELSREELQQYAADSEISLDGIPKRKADIIQAIRNAKSGSQG